MSVSELSEFLSPDQRKDVRAIGLKTILDLTGDPKTVAAILGCRNIIEAIHQNSYDDDPSIAKTALLTLINLSADDVGAIKIFGICNELRKEETPFAVDGIIDENSVVAGEWCKLLNNLTRVASLCVNWIETLEKNSEPWLMHLFNAFADPKHNKAGANIDYLGSVFCNLTQTRHGREIICDKDYHFLKMLLPFTCHPSPTRRKGVFGVIKNICFDTVHHAFLLDADDDVLSRILYPLCGPEEYSDEENDAFPIQLQFLDETKAREEDADLRKTIFETLLQLCAIRSSREHLRSKGVYAILREYHKWEANVGNDNCCLVACENVVDILIKNEQEIGFNDYKEIEIPADVAATFTEDDKA